VDSHPSESIPLEPEISFLTRDGLDRDLLNRAFRFASENHAEQERQSGEPYITHAVEVARILDELKLDSVTISSGLLHDTVEDTEVTVEDLVKQFGQEIALLVDAVTKIGELRFDSPEAVHAENYRKMLLSMAKDIRVILIKLADRLHNMRTLQYLPQRKIDRIARETLEIYAPLAHRFGIAKMKWELEDLAFKYSDPSAYKGLVEGISAKRRDRERYIEDFKRPLIQKLEESGIQAEINGRPKHFFSIYRKMRTRDKLLDEIFDLLAIRVVTGSVQDCYHVFGLIHTLYTPVQDRIKDYIATPKSNMYQSLHTTVVGPRGEMVEIQIRTNEMHATSEYGIAAHWRYKGGDPGGDDAPGEGMQWLLQVLDWQEDLTDPKEFMELLRIDLFQQEVFVFTPDGDLKRLAKGATALDFAFAVHTEVGKSCMGAKVNGRIVPLRYELKNGETVDIITSKSARPTHDWLEIARTSSAKSKIRRWLKHENQESSLQTGLEEVEREMRRLGIRGNTKKLLADHVEPLGFQEVGQLFAAVGRGDISCKLVVSRLVEKQVEEIPEQALSLEKIIDLTRRSERGVRIQGVDNLLIRFAQCCQPLPGDEITGIITRGRGVSIHKSTCLNASPMRMEASRLVPVDWDVEGGQTFPVKLLVFARDRHGLLGDIARAIGKIKTNIRSADMMREEKDAFGSFIVEVQSLENLRKVIKVIEKVKGVSGVQRRELL